MYCVLLAQIYIYLPTDIENFAALKGNVLFPTHQKLIAAEIYQSIYIYIYIYIYISVHELGVVLIRKMFSFQEAKGLFLYAESIVIECDANFRNAQLFMTALNHNLLIE